MMRKALGFAAGLTAILGLAQPVLAAATPLTSTKSTVLAGYNFANYIGVPGAVSATIVVPKLNCKATPPAGRSIYVGVGIQSVNSYARLYLACTPQGVARYYPSLVVNGTIKNIASDAAHAGDTIEFAVSQSDSQVTDSVIDMTHKFIVTAQWHRQRHGRGHHGRRLSGGFWLDDVRGAQLWHPRLLQRADQWIPVRLRRNWTPGRRPLRELDGPAPDQDHLLRQ